VASEASVKRAAAFFDGQNLFYAAKHAFGYRWPNYDPLKLARHVCALHGWQLAATHFYTGLPSVQDDPFWNHFWTAKLAQMGRVGIRTFSRHLKYRNQTVALAGGATTSVLVGSEKGIDIRLALDVVAAVYAKAIDVAIIFSQDQDLSEVSDEVRPTRTAGSSCPAPSRPARRTATRAGSTRPTGCGSVEPIMTPASIRGTIGREPDPLVNRP
jgi:uncharacterized LabA/DUF88 family protein